MARLIYITNISLDGFIEDQQGALDWAPPDDEVFVAMTGFLAGCGTFLYGRRLYEAMALWETDPSLAEQSALTRDFARTWQSAAKVVYSTTLDDVTTSATRVERRFDHDSVRRLVADADRDLTIGGADLAGQALDAGLVDECRLFVWPMILGAGKPGLSARTRQRLELVDEHRYGSGVMQLRYRVEASPT